MSVPVIDLFAGPGGLGEGFSREASVDFRIAVSIEKDGMAYETLRLRAAHRNLSKSRLVTAETWETWDRLVETEPWNVVFHMLRDSGNNAIERACRQADAEALHLELGPSNRARASQEITQRLGGHSGSRTLPKNAVLIGGPPCQAYSIVGRSRNRGIRDYRADADHRHFLYLEYLHVIAEFAPAVFVMENVKGILTSRVSDRQIFHTILRDLRRPDQVAGTGNPVEYVLLSLPEPTGLLDDPAPDDFIVHAEQYGIPQARHRVIILGVRRDVFERVAEIPRLVKSTPPTVLDVIGDLPPLRPQLSYRGQGKSWVEALRDPLFDDAAGQLARHRHPAAQDVARRMIELRGEIEDARRQAGPGGDRIRRSSADGRRPRALSEWYVDRRSSLLANHESRAHMPSDLVRYMFVAAFGEIVKESPKLVDFPRCLLPDHRNVDPENLGESIFKDRFRVQIGDRHSMTVTSHIAKDGHAFIHPRAKQCRSLTVREAARLQTFPDTYVFLGNRTSQYTQVGNAVPPLLASQIASVVARILRQAALC